MDEITKGHDLSTPVEVCAEMVRLLTDPQTTEGEMFMWFIDHLHEFSPDFRRDFMRAVIANPSDSASSVKEA